MASTTDEVDNNESVSTSESQVGFLPEEEEKCSIKAVLFPQNSDPSKLSGFIVNVSTCIIGFLIVAFCCLAALGKEALMNGTTWAISLLVIDFLLCFVVTVVIWRQPESKTKLSFKVPFLPVLPILSIFVNIYLMMQLDGGTWIRFAIWMSLGFVIYFGYGIWHSVEASYSAPTDAERSTDNNTDTCK